MRYDAMHLANSIIRYTWSQKKLYNDICLLKLMKLSYITLGHYLAEKEDDFFDENVEAWRYGPVIPSIWNEFKSFFLYNEITRSGGHKEIFRIDGRDKEDEFLWDLVIKICDKYKQDSPNGLVELTHAEGTPWHKYKKKLLMGKKNVIIPKKDIREYYKEFCQKSNGKKIKKNSEAETK